MLTTFFDGLTYDGSLLHCLINYGLLCISALALHRYQPARGWWACLLVATALQMALWFGANAAGVSVVWCMLAGFGLVAWRRAGTERSPGLRFLLAALLLDLAGIALYAGWFPPITTEAHLVAVVLGGIVQMLVHVLRKSRTTRRIEAA